MRLPTGPSSVFRAAAFVSCLALAAAAGPAALAAPAGEPAPTGATSTGTSTGTSTTPPGAAPGAVAAPSAGAAPAPMAGGSPPPVKSRVPSLSHDLQFGLALLFGGGYRVIARYGAQDYCGDQNNTEAAVCTHRTPFFINLQPSFGLSERWDVLVDLRVGLEQEVTVPYRQFLVMPGFRYWLDTQIHVKFFTTIQLAYDRTRQSATSTVGETDLGFRNSNGLMIEVMRNFGVYFQFGETIGFVRWASFTVDGGFGVQARVP
jgi:hypothetical protein